MNHIQKQEYKYLKRVTILLEKQTWSKEDFEYIRDSFDSFCKSVKLDKLSALRYGEVFLGKITKEYDLKDYNNSRSLIQHIIASVDSLEIPTIAVTVGAIIYLVLNEEDKK